MGIGWLGGVQASKALMEISGWTIRPLPASSDHRVRPMSAAELRRGEQSVLHCSGTRTLQVRTSPALPKKHLPGRRQVPPGQFPPGPALPQVSPALPGVPRPLLHGPLSQVSPPGGGPDVAFRFGAVLDGARTQEDVFRACGVRRLGDLALRG